MSSPQYCENCRLWFGGPEDLNQHIIEHEVSESQAEITQSVWFERGWTLQELLAPAKVVFYDRTWREIGTKHQLCAAIEKRTRIPREALIDEFRKIAANYCIAEKMRWSAGRRTTRLEDRAYSLMGIFNVSMPLLYGEGERAFQRLQEELIKISKDSSIFAWTRHIPDMLQLESSRSTGRGTSHGMLADSPDSFIGADLKGFWPAVRQFSFSKEGIEGGFALFRHKFEVSIAVLGHFGAFDLERRLPAKIFVMYLVRVAKDGYRRISIKGEPYAIFNQIMSRDAWNDLGLTSIRILPAPVIDYSLTDSSDLNSAGARSNLRRCYLGTEELDLLIFPGRIINVGTWIVPIPGSFSPPSIPLEFSTDHYMQINKSYGFSLQCVVLHRFGVGSHVLLFGYDLHGYPTLWFADVQYLEHPEGGSIFVIEQGVRVDTGLAGLEDEPEDAHMLEKFCQPGVARKEEGLSDHVEISILGNQAQVTFLANDNGHRVLFSHKDRQLMRRLPLKWVSLKPTGVLMRKNSLATF